MKTNLASKFLMMALVLALSSSLSAQADSKKNTERSKSEKKQSLATSSWVLPSSQTKAPIQVQAGRSVPVKFKLADANGLVSTSEMVKVSLNQLVSCDLSAAIKGSPAILVAPAPEVMSSPTASASASPSASVEESKSEKLNVLKIENGVFQYTWRIPRNQPGDCYQLVAQKGTMVVKSPLFKVRPSK